MEAFFLLAELPVRGPPSWKCSSAMLFIKEEEEEEEALHRVSNV